MPSLTTIRHWTLKIFSMGFLVAAADDIYDGSYVYAVIFLVLGIGLLSGKGWAQRGTAFFILLAAFVIPIGLINPFAASDYMTAFGEIPSASSMLIWIAPLEVVLLTLVWLIDPPKIKST